MSCNGTKNGGFDRLGHGCCPMRYSRFNVCSATTTETVVVLSAKGRSTVCMIACLLLIIQHQIKKIACLLLIIQLVNPDMQRLASDRLRPTRCAQKSTSPSTPYCAEESERKS
ncbi:MAG: hypothetical protein WB988_05280 [Candidatus Nitrosopolaris sp.]